MTNDELRTQRDRIIERIREIATEEGVDVAELKHRPIESDPDMSLTVWVYPYAGSGERIELVIPRRDVGFYNSARRVRRRLDYYIRTCLTEGIK